MTNWVPDLYCMCLLEVMGAAAASMICWQSCWLAITHARNSSTPLSVPTHLFTGQQALPAVSDCSSNASVNNQLQGLLLSCIRLSALVLVCLRYPVFDPPSPHF